MIFSTTGRAALARVSVVVMRPCCSRLVTRLRNTARRWSGCLPSFDPELRCRMVDPFTFLQGAKAPFHFLTATRGLKPPPPKDFGDPARLKPCPDEPRLQKSNCKRAQQGCAPAKQRAAQNTGPPRKAGPTNPTNPRPRCLRRTARRSGSGAAAK